MGARDIFMGLRGVRAQEAIRKARHEEARNHRAHRGFESPLELCQYIWPPAPRNDSGRAIGAENGRELRDRGPTTARKGCSVYSIHNGVCEGRLGAWPLEGTMMGASIYTTA